MQNKALISLFSEQLRNEINKIINERELDNPGQALIWWYFKRVNPLSDDDIEDVICDGSGDLGIDAILKDDKDIVHFYQFKHLSTPDKGYPTGDVDKSISGLELIIRGKYHGIANEKLKDKIREVLETIPLGYRIHLVSTGKGLEDEATIKLHAFILSLDPPSESFFRFCDEKIDYLQDRFYSRSLPTLNETITLNLDNTPYTVRTANHDSYTFHLAAEKIAEIYEKYGERILQQNIRMFEGDTPTNESIYRSCTDKDAENFFHYNNGISILADSASWDHFSKTLSINKPQIVNGGQTVRVLHRAKTDGILQPKVMVSARISTSQGDKEFAGNVAVNLNNQTRVEGSFLRSNNPRIIQLAAALRSLGWYIERRPGEIDEMDATERDIIEKSIDGSLSDRTIPLKEGTQAYTATFYENPGLARLNPNKMFLDVSDGGHFTRIFDNRLTAENFAQAYSLYKAISATINTFKSVKRRKKTIVNWREQYEKLLGKEFVDTRYPLFEQIVPQSTIFVIAVAYQWFIIKQKKSLLELTNSFRTSSETLHFVLEQIIKAQEAGGDQWNKSWQGLLKSQEFFLQVKTNMGIGDIP